MSRWLSGPGDYDILEVEWSRDRRRFGVLHRYCIGMMRLGHGVRFDDYD
jgi:hypothetical protein